MTDKEYAECVDSLVDRMKSTKCNSQSQSTNDDIIEDNKNGVTNSYSEDIV